MFYITCKIHSHKKTMNYNSSCKLLVLLAMCILYTFQQFFWHVTCLWDIAKLKAKHRKKVQCLVARVQWAVSFKIAELELWSEKKTVFVILVLNVQWEQLLFIHIYFCLIKIIFVILDGRPKVSDAQLKERLARLQNSESNQAANQQESCAQHQESFAQVLV